MMNRKIIHILEMVVELLLLIMILYFTYSRCTIQHRDKIEQVFRMLNHISAEAGHHGIDYKIISSETSTIVINKHIIYLVVWDKANQKMFDDNTIAGAAIHELAHILCSEYWIGGHGPKFNKMEAKLIKIATRLGYYDPKIPQDSNYPCLDS